MAVKFTQIGSTGDCAFWSCLPFGSKIYFGTYGYPRAYNYPPWTLVKSFAAGESVPRITSFGGTIYCVTENKGYIYRMNSPTDWVVVHDDSWEYGLGMASLGSYIYAAFCHRGEDRTKILYSSNGTSWPVADDWNGGEIVVLVPYNGKVYALGRKGGFLTGKTWARRGTGTSWADVRALCPNVVGTWRAGVVFNGYLFLGMGDRSDGKTKVYRFDGTNLSGELFSISAFKSHYTCVCNGYMYWLFGPHMNQGSSSAVNYYLYRTPTGDAGSWEHLKTFSVNPVSSHGKYRTKGCVGCLNNEPYVAVQNKVYKMEGVALVYTCPYCGATFSSQAELDAHIASEHPTIKVTCPTCHSLLEVTLGGEGGFGDWGGYGSNLLTNPSAEEGWAGWTKDEDGGSIIICSDWPPPPGATGTCHFGLATTYGYAIPKAWQDVDVSGKASLIDRGCVRIKTSGWRGNWPEESDKNRLIFEYLDSYGKVITSYDTGWLGGGTEKTWNKYEDSRVIPVGCRKIRVRMEWKSISTHCSPRWDELFVQLSEREYIPEPTENLLCPVCGAYIEKGVSIKLLAEGEFITQLRQQINALEIQAAQLEKVIADVRLQIEEIKAKLGMG